MSNSHQLPLLDALELPETLKVRINSDNNGKLATTQLPPMTPHPHKSFVLYLPTVLLRKRHNPAFALACRLANHHQVPLIVLCVVVDDAHMPSSPSNQRPVVMTARRLAFQLEAIQSAAQEWENHGAGILIRVHGPQARIPHHLTLARHSIAVVVDEPFCNPFLKYCLSVEQAASFARVPCFRVDGSTTVPPISKLQRVKDTNGNTVSYKGVPNKAWIWEKKTQPQRKTHVYGVVKDGHFDAPDLDIKLEPNFLSLLMSSQGDEYNLAQYLPADFLNNEVPAPGRRAWTAAEIADVENLKQWAMSWPGADLSVPPCPQTHGSALAGQERWSNFRPNHLKSYAKLRNQIQKPHAVSRMSCYLNLGVVSIFQVVYELWQEGSSAGASKFAEEVIKWREMSYAHCFACPATYNLAASIPEWSRRYLNNQRQVAHTQTLYSLEQLERGQSECGNWNSMQLYLVQTGELHNNARMTWGKTVVHWQKRQLSVEEVLQQLVYLNDRYALDGLSPPSYAGVLWCFGWCDKPKDAAGALSEKPSSRYRVGPEGFREAERILVSPEKKSQQSIVGMLQPRKKQRVQGRDEATTPAATNSSASRRPKNDGNTLLRYFSTPKKPSD